ncbi:MAG TPA: hypothetical protein VF221_09310 [Chloroflexota bacterium]
MTQAYRHDYRIGEAVLVHTSGVLIPGVIEDKNEGRLLVKMSEPWIDETGKQSDEGWFTPDQLDPSIEEETGGTQALPE